MPELPEVETVVRTLRGPLVGRTISRTQVRKPDVVAGGARRLARSLRGRSIERVSRRAKNILVALDDGRLLRVHLGMTGKLLFIRRGARGWTPHWCVRLRLEGGGSLVYDDVRRFGGLEVMDPDQWSERERLLGPEPLDPDYGPEDLRRALRSSRSPIRSWLLDGQHVAGVGNIYANEALFLAGVHPQRPAHSVSDDEAAALHAGLRATLSRAVELGGTTLRDYVDGDGNRGRFADNLLVYGREGLPCPNCGRPIERLVFGGRSAFSCVRCQR